MTKKKIEYVFSEDSQHMYKQGRHDGYEYMCSDIAMILSAFEGERLKKEIVKYLNKINPLAVEYYLSEEIEVNNSDN